MLLWFLFFSSSFIEIQLIHIQYCVSLRSAAWFDLHTSWNDSHSKLREYPSSHIDIKSKKYWYKNISLWSKFLGFIVLTTFMFIMSYIMSLVLIFVPFDWLHPIPTPPPPTSDKYKSDLFFYEFVFWSIVQFSLVAQ